MRIYRNFSEALNEIKRDLAEMGIKVHPQTMQNKQVADDPDYETLELQNYTYTVLDTDVSYLNPTQPWADAEFEERISGQRINPGEAWKQRRDVWDEFLVPFHAEGMNEPAMAFEYSYAERFNPAAAYGWGEYWNQIEMIIEELKKHPDSRQLFLSVWDPGIDIKNLGIHRVPCSLGYLFQNRGGELHVTYLMRSCDFATHFQNDLYLATRLRNHIAEKAGVKPGRFTQWIGSFHIYQKDVKGVF